MYKITLTKFPVTQPGRKIEFVRYCNTLSEAMIVRFQYMKRAEEYGWQLKSQSEVQGNYYRHYDKGNVSLCWVEESRLNVYKCDNFDIRPIK